MVGVLRNPNEDTFGREIEAFLILSQRLSPNDHKQVSVADNPLDALIYGLLVSRTSPLTARTAFARLWSRFPDWAGLSTTAIAEVVEAIKMTGFAQQRAGFIQKLVTQMQIDFPDGSYQKLREWDDAAVQSYLTSLPGVGTLIAHQVMLDTLDRPIMPLTQPIVRLISRMGMVYNLRQLERSLRIVAIHLPGEQRRQFHRDLLNHAQDVCRPRFPRCGRCRLTDLCSYYRQHRNDRSWPPRALDTSSDLPR